MPLPAHASLAAFIALCLAGPSMAADAGNGERLARRWCAECHVVAPDQPRAQSDAPTFAAISAERRVPQITAFLNQSHPRMPDMNLSRDEIADIIAYMHTLAPPTDPVTPPPAKDDYKPPARG
ncbi:MAG: c-type cytochrome [Beijerinckiaceae bacterium]|nr:c-type cytochrome [Beijerinckiaceae bacterium]